MSSSRPLSLLRRLAQLQERSAYVRRLRTNQTLSSSSSSSARALATTTTPTAASQQQQPPNNNNNNRLTASYDALVRRGSLTNDAQQRAVVARLAALLDQVDAYSQAHAQHAAKEKAWRERVASRLEALEEAERERDEREAAAAAAEAEARGAATPPNAPSPSGGGGWLSWLLSPSTAPSPSDPPPPLPLESPASAAARARRAAAARRSARVNAELGPPPPPPVPPRGVYIYGGVGSGKTMLMDLFFAAAAGKEGGDERGLGGSSNSSSSGGSARLRYARRLHFNAAMIELHQRLHRIEKERRRRQQQEQEEEQQDEGGGHEADDDDHAHQIERTVRDAEARKRKAARSAVLAVRRHLRRQRLGRVSEEAIAASDAEIMRQAVRAMIRGGGGEEEEEEEEEDEAHDDSAAAAGALVALDEMQAPDPFSVVFMRSLVKALRSERSIIVATSNRSPWSLPSAGLHESLHSSFIDGLVDAVDVVRLGGGAEGGEDQQQQQHVDYRRVALERALASSSALSSARGAGEEGDDSSTATAGLVPPTRAWPPLEEKGRSSSSSPSYFWPLGPAATAAMDSRWREFGGGVEEEEKEAFELPVGWGRTMAVARWKKGKGSSGRGRAARFTFDELCAGLLGPSDYHALAASFDTVFIEHVPRLSMRQRDKARRFITCVDELYNARRELVISAAASPEALFAGGGGGGGGGPGEGGAGGEAEDDDDAEPLVDLEQLQFETAAEGARLRRDVMTEGGVAPVASTEQAKRAAAQVLGGEEERFAFARAASRLLEMAAART